VASPIELYQLVGAALRDVAQARFMADLYSRQISFTYERDAMLRRFPVPRVEIDEAELSLFFTVTSVDVDPTRRTSRNAAVGSLFTQFSARIVRQWMDRLRSALRNATGDVAALEKRILTEDNLELWSGRLLQYLNESTDRVLDDRGELNAARVKADLDSQASDSGLPYAPLPELRAAQPNIAWQTLTADAARFRGSQIDALAQAIHGVNDRYPDYLVLVDVDPEVVKSAGSLVSSIKIKGSVKNYTWSKVDVDRSDMRNIRTLSRE
jgi:hypothetical protein